MKVRNTKTDEVKEVTLHPKVVKVKTLGDLNRFVITDGHGGYYWPIRTPYWRPIAYTFTTKESAQDMLAEIISDMKHEKKTMKIKQETQCVSDGDVERPRRIKVHFDNGNKMKIEQYGIPAESKEL